MQFDFGQNWAEFSDHALTSERVGQARTDFLRLLEGIPMLGRSILDIGFGQGLSLLTAASLGAKVVGCDINPKCGDVVRRNRKFFPNIADSEIPVVIGSILDEATVRTLQEQGPASGYDIVHSWGVLHHTGDMRQAIANAASLVKPGGYFVVALYNRHWSSQLWLAVKWLYVKSPRIVQKLLVYGLYPVIWFAKLLVTGANPWRKERGMDFFYDVVDWVGGYPYEYASIDEVKEIVGSMGFECLRAVAAQVPTGCNEFLFKKPV
ncbi:MAG: class I SAM-dependent methyltransferase [Nitrospira sp.]|nr:class I SAM-dependent methyltransferase [Nitrospira sp.]